jgi:hypothetical protein
VNLNRRNDDFDRGFGAFFAAAVVINLILLGVAIWAIIELVQWVTTK